MKTFLADKLVIKDDRLLKVWWDGKKIHRQRKRLPHTLIQTAIEAGLDLREIQRIYYENGKLSSIISIAKQLECSLGEATKLMNQFCGHKQRTTIEFGVSNN